MSSDITRYFADRDTRFHAIVRQQGRLPIDAEENFASDLAEWEHEDAFVETIAPSGSPDDGFRVTLPQAGPPANFNISAGSYYLGGARIENPAALTYRGQRARNWLTFPLDAEGTNETIGAARKFLVWLDATDQVVTATEDAELKDPGLGGPDGAAAKRFGWRVRSTAVSGPGCLLARQQWLAAMGWTGKVDAATGALKSNAQLSVTFNPADVDQDLCSPATTPGFLGARNDCYRVMLNRPGRFVWGRDNASPLYRVQVEAVGGQLRRVKFLTQPRDEDIHPRAGHTVELLRWSERLPNSQKTAEPMGEFFTVATGYANRSITLTTAVNSASTYWLAGLPTAALSAEDAVGEKQYFYLRLWSGGGSAGAPDHALAPGDLVGTGLRVSFAVGAMVGDSWVIGARPNAPTQMLPWALKSGMLPHAPRRHVVPLAVVDLDAGTVVDCRRRFRPLYKQGGCCTVTVGDDENSWGDVSTITEAIARLPLSGGEICIGLGTWRENVSLNGRNDITFTGCGSRSRWLPLDEDQPALRITGTSRIKVRRLTMQSSKAPCIVAMPAANAAANSDFTIEDCALTTTSGGVVRCAALSGLVIDRCRIVSGPMDDPVAANAAFAAITMQGERLAVRYCHITSPRDVTAQQVALGGIHVGGGSTTVAITDNRIADGAGNGITLGSVHMMKINGNAFTADPTSAIQQAINAAGGALGLAGFRVRIDEAGCIHIEEGDPTPTDDEDGDVEVPVSDGAIEDVCIAKNRIARCGANGIATFPLLPVNEKGEPGWDGIIVQNAVIKGNRIHANIRREPVSLPALQRLFCSPAGISLSFALDVAFRDNEISDNGNEPAREASGIFVGYGEGLRVERNRIERNGGLAAAFAGSTGGIVVRLATGGLPPSIPISMQDEDRPALLAHGNIVHAPAGRALKLIAHGPVMVTANRLTGANRSSLFANPLQSILLFLVGMSSGLDLLADPASPDLVDLALYDAALDAIGGDAVSIVNLSFVEEALFVYRLKRNAENFANDTNAMGSAALRDTVGLLRRENFRGGESQFNDNQVSLRGGIGELSAHFSSVFVVTLDDLGFADNQCEMEADVAFCIVDALLLGTTLRVTANRFQEPVVCPFSLLSMGGLMNTTALNQMTFYHAASCGVAAKLVDQNNIRIF